MRKPLMVGNWKMNNLTQESVELVEELISQLEDQSEVDTVVCPPFTSLPAVAKLIGRTNLELGAQNLFWEAGGAYTGEISALMLRDLGCRYVIIGHSERREYLGETNEIVNKKITAAESAGLIPIVCVGESLAERERGETLDILKKQLTEAFKDILREQALKLVIAYEPIWAIGTGRTATPAQAEEAHAHLRQMLTRLYDAELANRVKILYGGSVKPDNIDSLMVEADIDGALVGGASLDASAFGRIVKFKGKAKR